MAILNYSGNTKQENHYSGIIARFLKDVDIFPHVYVQGGVNTESYNIPTESVDDVIQDYVATPSTNVGTHTFKDRKVTLGKYMAFTKFDPTSLKQYWSEFAPHGQFIFRELPAEVQSSMVSLELNKVGSHNAKIAWQGDTALSTNLKYFNGYLKIATTDSEVIRVSSPLSAITKTNIISELERALTYGRANSDQFRIASYRKDMKLFMGYDAFEKYGDALRALTNKSISYEHATPTSFHGIQIVPQAYVPAHRFLFAEGSNSATSNMWLVVNDTMDLSSIQVDRLQTYSDEYFMKMVICMGVQFARPEEVVLY